jgi:hypothetical protein
MQALPGHLALDLSTTGETSTPLLRPSGFMGSKRELLIAGNSLPQGGKAAEAQGAYPALGTIGTNRPDTTGKPCQ